MFGKGQRRPWTALLISMLLAALLAACGGKDEATPTVEPSTDRTPSRETAATDTPPPVEGPSVTITFACYDWEVGEFEKLADEFHRLNSDVKVQFVSIYEALGIEMGDDWPEDAAEKLAAAADTTRSDQYSQSQGLLRDLQPFIEADRTFDPDDFYPGMLEAYQGDGGQWAVPAVVSFQLIQYDKGFFDEAGVDYPQPGWTWDDFLDKAKQLTVRDGDQVTRYGLVDPTGQTTSLAVILSQAGSLVDETTDPPTLRLDRPEVAEAVQWYADLILEHGVMPGPAADDPEDYNELYALTEDKAAMSIGGAFVALWPGQEELKGIVSLPRGKTAVNPMWVQGYVMSAGTQHPDESWRWLVFLTRHYQASGFAMSNRLPVRRSVAEESGLWEDLAEDQVAAYQDALEHPFPLNRMPGVWVPLREAILAVVKGESDVRAALSEAQTKAMETLAVAGKPSEEATPVVVATPRPEPEPGAGELIRFSVLGADLSHYRKLADEFHQLHPDITVKVTQPSFTEPSFGLEDLFEGVDCVAGYADLSDPEYRALLLNLQPFLEGDEDLSLDDFYPQALSAFRWEGELWGLPAQGNVYLMIYNKTLFEAAAVPYPRAGWTVEDFASTAQALTSGEGDDKQYGFVPYLGEMMDMDFFIEQWGVELIDYDTDPPTIHFDDPATVEAVQWYADLALVHGVKPALPINAYSTDIAGYQERMSLISSGRAAMWTSYGDMLITGLSYLLPDDFEYGFTSMPLAPEGKGYGQIYFSGYFITAEAAHPQACWDWLIFLTERPGETGGLSARRSVAESEAFRQQVGEELADAYQFVISHSQEAARLPTDEIGQIGMSAYWFYAAYDSIIEGQEAETALAWAQDMAEDFAACLASREDLEGQELTKTCATQVDPDFPVQVFGGE
jgi:ABC-type glycerol-3-phosphate transport system substrate-binding protein